MKKERETFNHQCSFLPTSQSTLPFRPYLIPRRARVTPTKASPRVHPPFVHFSSLPFFRGEKSSKKSVMKTRQHHTGKSRTTTKTTTTASLVFHGTVRPFVPSETAVQPAVRISSSSSSPSRFGCVFLSLFRAPSSPRVARRTVAISVVWKAFSTRNKVSCFPTRGVNSRYHHHHLSLYMYI